MKMDKGRADSYLEVFYEMWPLLATAFLVGVVRCWTHVKKSYLQEHLGATILNIFISSLFMAFMAVGMALLLPLAGVDVSPEIEVGIVTMISGMGMKTVDAFVRKKLGLSIVDEKAEEKNEEKKD